MKIIISESQYNRLFEYHAQQRLPFEDDDNFDLDKKYAYKNMAEEFMDWIEEFGKIGELPPSKYTVHKGIREGWEQALEWFSGNIEDEGKENNSEKFRQALQKHGFMFIYDDGVDTNCTFDKKGNMYVERMISLPLEMGNTDFGTNFEELVTDYQNNVGGCWSWKFGGAYSYCSDGSNHNIVMQGYIRLEDIDWVETLYLNAYSESYECEIRVKPNAKVELFKITCPSEKYEFPLNGRHIIVTATYFGNRQKYGSNGYANVYSSTSKEELFADRNGNILTLTDVFKRKLEQVKNGEKEEYEVFDRQEQINENMAIVFLNDWAFIIDGNYNLIYDTPFINAKDYFSYGVYVLNFDCKVNLIDPDTRKFKLNNWYDSLKITRNGLLFIREDDMHGIYNDSGDIDFKFSFVGEISNDSLKTELCKVKYCDSYYVVDRKGNMYGCPKMPYQFNVERDPNGGYIFEFNREISISKPPRIFIYNSRTNELVEKKENEQQF